MNDHATCTNIFVYPVFSTDYTKAVRITLQRVEIDLNLKVNTQIHTSKGPISPIMIFTSFNYSSSLLVLAILLFSLVIQNEAIVNGEDAQLGEFPYIVSLRNKSGNHYCAGTLVTSTHIVTSAQCIYEDHVIFYGGEPKKLKPEDISVVVGTLSAKEGGDAYEIERFVTHPEHDITQFYSLQYDIAVVVLKKPVNTESVVSKWSDISNPPRDNSEGKTAGWGLIKYAPPLKVNATVLQQLNVKIQNKEECKNDWQETLGLLPETQKIIVRISPDNIICAIPTLKNAGGCIRDVGNPLIVDNELVGIMIGGYVCAHGLADFYTSWSAYRPFVQQVIADKIQ